MYSTTRICETNEERNGLNRTYIRQQLKVTFYITCYVNATEVLKQEIHIRHRHAKNFILIARQDLLSQIYDLVKRWRSLCHSISKNNITS